MAELENNVIIQDEDSYNKPIKTIITPERKKDIDLDKTLYDNIIQAGLNSTLDITSLSSLNQTAENRNQMYNIYDSMCEDGTISAVVETYAEDATERNDNGDIIWVEAADDNIAKCVNYFLDTLNVNKNIYKWVYSLCKYGDVYLRLYRESEYNDDLFKDKKTLNEDIKIKSYKKSDNYAHYMEMVKNPAEMFELTKFGKTVGYVKAPTNNVLAKNTDTSFTTFKYKFKREDVTLYPATEFVHAALEESTTRDEELINIFLDQESYDNDDTNYSYVVRKGQSLLSNVYKVWRELNLLENSVLLNRITKSSIVRMINVEVGDMPKENVAKTLLGIKQMVEQKSAINTGNGMSEYTNPGPVENNVYVPTHEGVGAISTTQIGGDVDVKSLADLDYYMNKLYGQLRVPKQYFSQTDDSTGFNGGSSLSIISSRYAKMIKRIQNTMIQAITDAVNLMLLDKGLDSYVNEFTIHMLPPTTQEEIDRRDNLSSKVQLTSDIMNMLSDIEDVASKLKILKSLLTNIVTDNEIIGVIQEQIEMLEAQRVADESVDDETDDFGDGDFSDSGGGVSNFNDSFSSDMSDETSFDDETGETFEDTTEDETSDSDTVLPSGEDLGVDLTTDSE